MKLELSRKERKLLIGSLQNRIDIIDRLLTSFSQDYLISTYTQDKNDLLELKNKISIVTNKELNQNNLK
jgi:hypothetical protein